MTVDDAATAPPESPWVDESWDSALVIAAHPDDIEYGIAGAVARWTGQGKRVTYCLATRGEAGIDGIAPEVAGPLREQEERAGAAIVGVTELEFLDHQDGVVEYGLPLRRDIARVVRAHRPDVVVTGYYGDTWAPGMLNQADHIALGRAVVDGVRDAGNRWVFRELLDEGLEPHHVRTLLVGGGPASAKGVDVSDTFDVGMESLAAHAAYMRGLSEDAMAETRGFIESFARQAGERLGCTYAVIFDVIDL